MPSVTRLSPIRSLRSTLGLERARLASILEISDADLAAIEKSTVNASAAVLRDLAVVLDAPLPVITGNAAAFKKHAAEVRASAAFGALQVSVVGHELEYPISVAARDSVRRQVAKHDVQEDAAGSWLTAWTLDNKLLFLNLAHVLGIGLVGDDEEQAPSFEHPEVYKALADWELEENDDLGPVVRGRCEAIFAQEDGEETAKATKYARIISDAGGASWYFLFDEADATGYYTLMLAADQVIAPNRLMQVRDEGDQLERFLNLSRVAVIEVPAERYNELLANEEDS